MAALGDHTQIAVMTSIKKSRRATRNHRRGTRRPRLYVAAILLASVVGVVVLIRHTPTDPASDDRSRSIPGREAPRVAASVESPAIDVNQAADRLLAAVDPAVPDNAWFPAPAREALEWLYAEVRVGRLTIAVLERLDKTNLHGNVLMASGIVENRPTLLIAEPRLRTFLADGDGLSRPFTRKQRNDFMLGLVHEAVHLRKPQLPAPANSSYEERVAEELRAWRTVSVEVVRPLRRIGEPVDSVFIRIDDALLACDDRSDCQVLRASMIPAEVPLTR
jgi:hypothetical protein